jgi:hypothetical protein
MLILIRTMQSVSEFQEIYIDARGKLTQIS